MSKKKGVYDDKFRSSAVIMLEAADYPSQKGALERTAKSLGVHARTLSRWFNGEQNPPPDRMVNEKRLEIVDIIRNEIYAAFDAAPGARPDASYRDLITGAAILVDKLQLLEGKPTWIVEITNLLKDGTLTPQDIMNEFADEPEAAIGLLESFGLSATEISEAQAQSAERG